MKKTGLKQKSNQEIYLELVETKEQRKEFNEITEKYHSYKKSSHYVGRQINWLIKNKNNNATLGCIGVGSCPFTIAVRGRYIGWKGLSHPNIDKAKLKNLVKIGSNWRFTLKPNAKINASKIISLFCREAKKEWKKKHGDNLVLLETMVKPPRKGTLYKASGWKFIGYTSGWSFPKRTYGLIKNFREIAIKVPKKLVFIKPLHRLWRKELLMK